MIDGIVAPDWRGWEGPSDDPNDRQFGDVIEGAEKGDVADDPDAVLLGEPYDGAVIGRRGAREGPLAIRRSLAGTKTAHCTAGATSPLSATRIVDIGDVARSGDVADDQTGADVADDQTGSDVADDPTGGDVAAVQTQVREVAGEVHALDSLPVFLGGDNSLSYANVAPLLDRGQVGVVNFDAHLDCRALHDGPTSGTPYRQLIEDGLDTYVAVGVRHFETSGPYVEYVRDRGGTIVPADAFDDGVDAAVEAVREAVADVELLYISVDCDVLDAAVAPGVSAPTPGGLTARELFAAVGDLVCDDRLAGFEIVECAPPLDVDGRTVDAAARTVAHALYGALVRRNGGDDTDNDHNQ
ncbi:Arginase family enzyme [Halalkaliarchaeum sp. AArc-CO]|uniref:agmatinase family protein n=1 Tax=unclassified Halalkaliarchaeum TaxID=2678344 RepID=UPI00217D173B|nr:MULTISPECIES: agmatinase family protein [unclassified Halalkaliarchaeum]MDR5672116.1 agmatinase family protein [Halalkaliarchaeum sp. AArc-GB]UWG51621.1 Arginase family enzyme [Halalkaliarchaeum sp. AArc-CO]